jgi:predicted acyl esterase
MTHGTYDEYWQSRNVPKDLTNVRTPVLVVAGWFDAEDHYGPFMMYEALVKKSPGNATRLVVGPWSHGSWACGTGERSATSRSARRRASTSAPRSSFRSSTIT